MSKIEAGVPAEAIVPAARNAFRVTVAPQPLERGAVLQRVLREIGPEAEQSFLRGQNDKLTEQWSQIRHLNLVGSGRKGWLSTSFNTTPEKVWQLAAALCGGGLAALRRQERSPLVEMEWDAQKKIRQLPAAEVAAFLGTHGHLAPLLRCLVDMARCNGQFLQRNAQSLRSLLASLLDGGLEGMARCVAILTAEKQLSVAYEKTARPPQWADEAQSPKAAAAASPIELTLAASGAGARRLAAAAGSGPAPLTEALAPRPKRAFMVPRRAGSPPVGVARAQMPLVLRLPYSDAEGLVVLNDKLEAARQKAERLAGGAPQAQLFWRLWQLSDCDFEQDAFCAQLAAEHPHLSGAERQDVYTKTERSMEAFCGGGLPGLAAWHRHNNPKAPEGALRAECTEMWSALTPEQVVRFEAEQPNSNGVLQALQAFIGRSPFLLSRASERALAGVFAAFAASGLAGLAEATDMLRTNEFATADKGLEIYLKQRAAPAAQVAAGRGSTPAAPASLAAAIGRRHSAPAAAPAGDTPAAAPSLAAAVGRRHSAPAAAPAADGPAAALSLAVAMGRRHSAPAAAPHSSVQPMLPPLEPEMLRERRSAPAALQANSFAAQERYPKGQPFAVGAGETDPLLAEIHMFVDLHDQVNFASAPAAEQVAAESSTRPAKKRRLDHFAAPPPSFASTSDSAAGGEQGPISPAELYPKASVGKEGPQLLPGLVGTPSAERSRAQSPSLSPLAVTSSMSTSSSLWGQSNAVAPPRMQPIHPAGPSPYSGPLGAFEHVVCSQAAMLFCLTKICPATAAQTREEMHINGIRVQLTRSELRQMVGQAD